MRHCANSLRSFPAWTVVDGLAGSGTPMLRHTSAGTRSTKAAPSFDATKVKATSEMVAKPWPCIQVIRCWCTPKSSSKVLKSALLSMDVMARQGLVDIYSRINDSWQKKRGKTRKKLVIWLTCWIFCEEATWVQLAWICLLNLTYLLSRVTVIQVRSSRRYSWISCPAWPEKQPRKKNSF